MKKRFSGFTDETAPGFSLNVEASRTINLYPEVTSPHGENPERLVLYGTPGLRVFARLADGPIRAQHTEIYQFPSTDRSFAVSGSHFYEIFDDGTSIDRGTVANDGFIAYIASNGFQIVIASFHKGYLFDLATNAFSGPIVDDNGDEIPLLNVVAHANRFVGVFVSPDFRQRIFYSALDDGDDWPALNFLSADIAPDNIVALLADHEQLWAFGDTSVQPFANSTDQDNPFVAIPGAMIETGCAAPASPVRLDNTIFWIGGDARGRAIVWRAVGYAAKRVSTHAIENMIRRMPAIWDCRSYGYSENGHAFAVFSFPIGRNTLTFDASNGKWHERGCWDVADGGSFDAHHAWSHSFAFGRHLVGDRGGDCCAAVEGPGPIDVVRITTVCPLADAAEDVVYASAFTATGGIAPYTWALISGAFPAGLTLATDGTLSGTPTESGVFSFTVTATDSSDPPLTDELTCQIAITAAPEVPGILLDITLEMIDGGLTTLTSGAITFERTMIGLDPDDYVGTDRWEFEVVARNGHASIDYAVELVDEAGNLYASIVVAANTPAVSTSRLRSARTTFVPAIASTVYMVRLPATAVNGDLVVNAARIVPVPIATGFTSAKLQFPLGNAGYSGQNASESNEFFHWAFNSTVFGQSHPEQCTIFLKDTGAWATIADWQFESVGMRTGFTTDSAELGLYNKTTDVSVAMNAHGTTINVLDYRIQTIADDAVNFADGDEFEVRGRSTVPSVAAQFYRAALYVRLTNLSKALVYRRVAMSAEISTTTVIEHQRQLLSLADSGAVYLEVTAAESVSGDVGIQPKTSGADSGTTGTSLTASRLNFTTKARQRTAAIVAADGDRTTVEVPRVSGTLQVSAAFIVLEYEA